MLFHPWLAYVSQYFGMFDIPNAEDLLTFDMLNSFSELFFITQHWNDTSI